MARVEEELTGAGPEGSYCLGEKMGTIVSPGDAEIVWGSLLWGLRARGTVQAN